MGINGAMFNRSKDMSIAELKAAIETIRRHRTIGDDSNARHEKLEKRLRSKHLKALLKEKEKKK